MRKLLAIALIAAGLWGGYWFVGSAAVERGVAAWFDARRAQGWVSSYDSLNTAGFPSRFDTTITDLALADPDNGLRWDAPMLQILALSYRPNHIIAVLPPRQSLTGPGARVEITSDDMRGSVIFVPGTALALDHSSFVMQNVALAGDAGWSMALSEAQFATRRTVATPNAHDIAFTATGLAPTRDARQRLDPGQVLPATIDALRIDGTVQFDAPWDRFAVEGPKPQPAAIDLKLAQITWGRLDLQASGSLTLDDQGVPTGRIMVRAAQWRDMLGMAVAGGMVPAGLADTVERGLALLAGLSGDPETLETPLSFQNGMVSFGPLPLGPAPRLRLR